MTNNPLITASICLGLAIIITICMFVAYFLRRLSGMATVMFSFLSADLVVISMLFFNVCIPPADKIGDQAFMIESQNEQIAEGNSPPNITYLSFTPSMRQVTVGQNGEVNVTDYVKVNATTIKFRSKIDDKIYVGTVTEDRLKFWTHKDVRIEIVEENQNIAQHYSPETANNNPENSKNETPQGLKFEENRPISIYET